MLKKRAFLFIVLTILALPGCGKREKEEETATRIDERAENKGNNKSKRKHVGQHKKFHMLKQENKKQQKERGLLFQR